MTQKKTAESDASVENSSIDARTGQPNTPSTPEQLLQDQSHDVSALLAELEQVRRQAAENLDKFMRSKAETENVRRRTETDVANAHKYAIERFAVEMLSVKDSLERARAVQAQAGAPLVEKMFEGLDLTLKLMDTIFLKFALTPLVPQKGEKFDPEKHQAMSLLESGEIPPNHVVATVQKGYILNDRLLRPAMVIVSKAVSPPENT
jgi:molecular chaperone GrpE